VSIVCNDTSQQALWTKNAPARQKMSTREKEKKNMYREYYQCANTARVYKERGRERERGRDMGMIT